MTTENPQCVIDGNSIVTCSANIQRNENRLPNEKLFHFGCVFLPFPVSTYIFFNNKFVAFNLCWLFCCLEFDLSHLYSTTFPFPPPKGIGINKKFIRILTTIFSYCSGCLISFTVCLASELCFCPISDFWPCTS